MKTPVLYRQSDGEKFVLQGDGLYVMESSEMANPHRFTHARLMLREGFFKSEPPTKTEEYQRPLKGCGYE